MSTNIDALACAHDLEWLASAPQLRGRAKAMRNVVTVIAELTKARAIEARADGQ